MRDRAVNSRARRASGPAITLTETDRRAAALLADLGEVRYVSTYGEMLVKRGVVKSFAGKHYTRQGLALMAGRQLARLRRLGLARYGLGGYWPTEAARAFCGAKTDACLSPGSRCAL